MNSCSCASRSQDGYSNAKDQFEAEPPKDTLPPSGLPKQEDERDAEADPVHHVIRSSNGEGNGLRGSGADYRVSEQRPDTERLDRER